MQRRKAILRLPSPPQNASDLISDEAELRRQLNWTIKRAMLEVGALISNYAMKSSLLRCGRNLDCVVTKRQEEVLGLVCRGMTNKEIGSALGITERTVKFHVQCLNRIFGVKEGNSRSARYALMRIA